MGSMLDRRFFELIKRTDHKGSVLESYKAVYARSTMVLFSRKTRSPLAALTLKADDVGCLSMLTGRPAPAGAPDPYFQGMLNMPDQTFTFTISNLSEDMINFNILHTPHRVSAVNPGPSYGINQVNELRQNESYTIAADQRNNRRMILTGKTITIKDPETSMEKQVAVTVKQSEADPDKPRGLYFYLSVVPDMSCKSLVDKFAEGTAWKVSTGFVRRVAGSPHETFVHAHRVPPMPARLPDRFHITHRDSQPSPNLHRPAPDAGEESPEEMAIRELAEQETQSASESISRRSNRAIWVPPARVEVGGRVLEGREFVDYCEKNGMCRICGKVKVKESRGLWGFSPIAIQCNMKGEISVYKGYCISPTCYSLEDAKRELGEIKTVWALPKKDTPEPKIPQGVWASPDPGIEVLPDAEVRSSGTHSSGETQKMSESFPRNEIRVDST